MPDNSIRLLRINVYEYLYDELKSGRLQPGKSISLNKLSSELGVSKTPLRDAILELQAEGFVTLYPQRGVHINILTTEQKKDIYEVCSVLDAKIVKNVFDKITKNEINELKKINALMDPSRPDLTCDNYNTHNVSFHDVYLNLSSNDFLNKIVRTSRIRLFQFSHDNWGRDFAQVNFNEHKKIIELFELGKSEVLADYIQNTHWSFNW